MAVTKFVKGGLLHAFNLKRHNFMCKKVIRLNFLSYKYNDRKVLLTNLKAVGPTQAELHSLEV